MGALAKTYARLRTGKAFFIALAIFCGVWTGWNWFMPRQLRFDDPGYPILTLILSVEASLAASAIIVANRDAEARQQEQLRYLLDISRSILTLLEHTADKEKERTAHESQSAT